MDWLRRDVMVYRQLLIDRQDLLAPMGDLTDKPRQNLYSVVLDLYWVALHHALGVLELLEEELRAPLGVVQRALFETVVSLKYLVTRPDPVYEALVYRAYSLLKEQAFFPDDQALVAERDRVLAEMPDEAVTAARSRIAKRQSWSGQNMRVMAERADFTGYELYGWLSEEAHSRVIGYHARLEKQDDTKGQIRLGRPIQSPEREDMANFARRMLSHAFTLFWRQFKGGPIDLETSDPHKWLEQP